jgi:hypothetical protein
VQAFDDDEKKALDLYAEDGEEEHGERVQSEVSTVLLAHLSLRTRDCDVLLTRSR